MEKALLFLPETFVLLAALAVFAGLIVRAAAETARFLAIAGASLALVTCVALLGMDGEPFFPGIYRVDLFSQLLKLLILATLLLVLFMSGRPGTMRHDAWPELPFFLLPATAGMMMLVSATELLTLYVALELSAFPLYALVALHRGGSRGGEGASKYMLQGMVASAVSLYGMSFLFGLTGTTYLADIAAAAPGLAHQPLFWVGLLLTLGGFLFKLALFPFHFWAPDTYETAPHPIVTFIATASKAATIGVLCRLLGLVVAGEGAADGEALRLAFIIFGVAAMTLGNLAALVQTDLKRLLGYSAVAHAGYIVVGLQAFSHLGMTSVIFYTFGYLAMTYVCFLVVNEVARDRDDVPIEAVAGLWRRSPFLGLCLLIGIFGLTGLPPTVGFIGKWFLFSAALENGQFLLVLIAAANSAIAIFYYLRVIRMAYLVDSEEAALRPAPLVIAGAAVASIIVLWMGIHPGTLWQIIETSTGPLVAAF